MGPEMVQLTTDKVRVIRKRMKEAQDRQNSYADSRRRPLEFQVGDKVFLKVALERHHSNWSKREISPEIYWPF